MKKKLLSLLLALALCVSLLPATALADDSALPSTAPTPITSAYIEDHHTLTEGSYYLDEGITLTETLTVTGTVTLDLKGHVLKRTGSGSVIKVTESGDLTLKDSNSTATHSDTSLPAGGVITGGTGDETSLNNQYGGGVYNEGKFTMSGGTITGCSLTGKNVNYGGGVYNRGAFTMSGGTIAGCSLTDGGFNYGGGVYSATGSTFIMSGGTISNCTPRAICTGGDETNAASFTISGSANVQGSVYMATYSIMYANGGTISGEVKSDNDTTITRSAEGTDLDTYTTFSGAVKGYVNIEDAAKLTVTFDSNGGSAVAAQHFLKGQNQKATKPADPTRTGYTFTGWLQKVMVAAGDQYIGSSGTWESDSYSTTYESYDFFEAVTDNITLCAGWKANSYTVKFNANATDATGTMSDQTFIYDEEQALNANTMTRTGYTFAGWATKEGGAKVYDDKALVKNLSTGDSVVLYAVWQVNSYTVTFDSNGGSAVDAQSVARGTAAAKPADPGRKGYLFDGWYLNGEKYDFTTPVTGPITLVARWSPVVNDAQIVGAIHGTVTLSPRYADTGDTVTVTATPDKGYALSSLTVTDSAGRTVTLTKNADGTYAFRMPRGGVTVKAVFTAEVSFVDVPESKYFHDAVVWAAANGITTGTDATHFSPYASCTRAHAVTYLYRSAIAMGLDVSAGEDTNILSYNDAFDVPEYAIPAFQWACALGIVTGNDGDLNPNAPCTRAQIAAFLWRFAKAAGMDVSVGEDTNILSYNDAFDVPEYAIPAFQWACGENVVTGNNGNLLPQGGCTRAQTVTFLYRLLAE